MSSPFSEAEKYKERRKNSRLSTGSFKGRFGATSPSRPSSWRETSSRFGAGSDGSSSSSPLPPSSGSSSSLAGLTPNRRSFNKIANSASNFQTYASRYIESIRPRSWGNRGGSSSSSAGSASLQPPESSFHSGGSSRAESPSSPPIVGGTSSFPQLLSFRSPNRLSPLPSSSPSFSLGARRKQAESRSELGWFRHITEAKTAYEAGRKAGSLRGGAGPAGPTPLDQNGLDPKEVDGGKLASRSHSFHEGSRRSDGTQSGSDNTGDEGTVAKKTGSSGPKKRLQRVEILRIAEPCPLIDPSQVVVTKGKVLIAEPILTPIEKLRRKDAEVTAALLEKQRLISEILNIPASNSSEGGDFDTSASDDQPTSEQNKEAREVLLAALAQAKSLSELVNDSLNLGEGDRVLAASAPEVDEDEEDKPPALPPRPPKLIMLSDATTTESSSDTGATTTATTSANPTANEGAEKRLPMVGPSADKLLSISSNMHEHLTTLLAIIQDRDEERDRLRREVQRSQEQVHALLASGASVGAASVPTSPLSLGGEGASSPPATRGAAAAVTSPTRPASFISVEDTSSGAEQFSSSGATTESRTTHESEEDAPDTPEATEKDVLSEGTLTSDSSPNAKTPTHETAEKKFTDEENASQDNVNSFKDGEKEDIL